MESESVHPPTGLFKQDTVSAASVFEQDTAPAVAALRPSVLPEPGFRTEERREAESDRRVGALDHLPALEPGIGVPGIGVPNWILDKEARYRHALAAADVTAASVAVLAAAVMVGDGQASGWALLAIPVAIVIAKVVGLYDRDKDLVAKTTLDEAPTLLQVAMLYTLVLSAGASSFFGGQLQPPQIVVLFAVLLGSLFMLRAATRTTVLRLSAPERCLIVADQRTYERLRSKLEGSRFVNVEIVGRAATSANPGTIRDTLGTIAELRRIVTERRVHRVILAPTAGAADHLDAIRFVSSVGVRVSLAPPLFEVVGPSVRFDDVDGLCLMGVPEFGLSRSSRALKRCFDITVAGLGLAVLAPVFATIAVAIKLGSPGPVFFRQPRIGWRGREFEMVKFRSMIADAESRKENLVELNEAGNGLFKLANDPRVTRVGFLLRRLSLDELPQLLNVLKGEMSLVGPRPLVPEDDCHVEGWDRRRLAVLPGMTGVWQVLGSSRIPMPEMVKLDYLYAANWSLWNDVKILVRTIPLIYGRKGI